ncbi:serine/threonine-protein kinase [Nocardioides sp. HM23]|uniref:serine/threonine-protein kinase n=1 Tax=Nocardioides bizhenqiangii TaxID=3095076 RepID=UPI002ACA94D1|nr:serine/threonine-protein kinase [Nocardioides sp. HM23]MDZ5623547.1 serine/threonine-protein kinase [Nocardioides sp. HM23]
MMLRLFARGDTLDGIVPPGGELLTGYAVVALMRRGGRLDTYDVYSRERDCRCVVKVVRPDRAHEVHVRAALVGEGALLRELAHPHLVRAYDVIEGPRTAVVLETLTGSTLAALIEESPLGPRDVALLGRQLASALGYLHRRDWLHLDVKPSNVVVQGGRAVLIDLSLATHPGDGRPHAGTDGYLAPEQVTGRNLSPATDVFGLGTTLGEALTGELPYGEEDRWVTGTAPRRATRPFRRRLSRSAGPLAEVITACLDPDPERRPSLTSACEVLDAVIAGTTSAGA